MKKLKHITTRRGMTTLLFGLLGLSIQAQEVHSSGKPIITIFDQIGVSFDNSGELSKVGFNLERAYLGYQYQFNENWSTKVVYDMGKGDDASMQRMGYVKNAQVDYKNGGFKMSAGLTSTRQFKVQEDFWGHRYVYKSYLDECKWASSADMGFTAEQKVCKGLSVDISMMNGEGYKKLQADKHMQYSLGITAEPMEGLLLRGYADLKTADAGNPQSNMGLFVGYKLSKFRIGAEYNMQLNNGNVDGHSLTGLSLYAVAQLKEQSELFARCDYGTSNTTVTADAWNYKYDGTTLLLGYQYKANKMLSISPNALMNIDAAGVKTFAVNLSAQIKL